MLNGAIRIHNEGPPTRIHHAVGATTATIPTTRPRADRIGVRSAKSMVFASQIGVRVPLATLHSAASTGPVPVSTLDARAFGSIPLGIGDRSVGSTLWPSILRITSFWEATLIAVLSLLISVLVGIRLVEVLSDRDVDVPPSRLVAGTAREPETRSGSPSGEDERHDSPTADHRPYEHYLSPETPPELLSDEGKVVRLLVANRGRIRQHRIADETGWSKSKVSRICSQMHADDLIEKRSVGRENLITLSDRTRDEETGPDEVENPLP